MSDPIGALEAQGMNKPMSEDTPAPSNRYLVVESPPGTPANVFHVYGYMRTPRADRQGTVSVPEWGWGPVTFPLMVDGMGTLFAYARENRFGVAAGADRYPKPDVGTVFEWEFVTRRPDSLHLEPDPLWLDKAEARFDALLSGEKE